MVLTTALGVGATVGADPVRHRGIRVRTLLDGQVRRVRRTLTLLFGAVMLVLLIACANVTHLLLARVGEREREMGLRFALGAGRARVWRLVLTESLLVALAGGAAGTLLAAWIVDALLALRPPMIPRLDSVGLDGTAAAVI
jgi:ABC-type antimicrobial peptide transport system permease subunit